METDIIIRALITSVYVILATPRRGWRKKIIAKSDVSNAVRNRRIAPRRNKVKTRLFSRPARLEAAARVRKGNFWPRDRGGFTSR